MCRYTLLFCTPFHRPSTPPYLSVSLLPSDSALSCILSTQTPWPSLPQDPLVLIFFYCLWILGSSAVCNSPRQWCFSLCFSLLGVLFLVELLFLWQGKSHHRIVPALVMRMKTGRAIVWRFESLKIKLWSSHPAIGYITDNIWKLDLKEICACRVQNGTVHLQLGRKLVCINERLWEQTWLSIHGKHC